MRKAQKPTPNSQRIGLTLKESTIASIDRARADIRDKHKRVVERNELLEHILSGVDYDSLVNEFSIEGRIVA